MPTLMRIIVGSKFIEAYFDTQEKAIEVFNGLYLALAECDENQPYTVCLEPVTGKEIKEI